ncbi:probable 28S ribosomal protein S10, mitochondrial [Pimephales promelas]|uniref:probable 28S ribosomal protein S10, mitochondrial n=1 Tax=Pimephales promelas TaxID=90988 RepID=UPI0019558F5A|nr:probable 28S ribosomal protein S10, mitochondrial [Pimephales promelas]KAG1932622.1 28S ribosomal protein S10, mitochondrial [Pimephales promelas]
MIPKPKGSRGDLYLGTLSRVRVLTSLPSPVEAENMAASMASVLSKTINRHFLQAVAAQRQTRLIHTSPSPVVSEEPDTLYQRLSVEVKGHDRSVLDSYEFFATLAARELGLTLEKVFEPPKHIDKLTLLKSVHIFKKHRAQYEMRTHRRLIQISGITGSSARVYLEYIQRNLPEGVAMEITKTAIEKIPEHIQKPLWDEHNQ